MAVPNAHIELAAENTHIHGAEYFLDPATTNVTITHISSEEALTPNFGRHNIVQCLLNNRILVVWLTHVYPFGFQYIQQHLSSSGGLQGKYTMVEEKRVEHVRREPAAYPPFDGWYHPNPMDLVQIHHLIHLEGQRKVFSWDSPWWVCVGDNPLPLLPVQED